MHNQLPTILFAGPSLTEKSRRFCQEKGIILLPPAKRGDIHKLLDDGFIGKIILADGVFHQVIAVGHAELRHAIEMKCEVVGLSSMGAIRAYEMRFLGMVGYGKVYEYFFKMDDFQDDEMALFHLPAPHFHAITEPMVHFRYCVDCLIEENLINKEVGANLISSLKSYYYGDRTLSLFFELLGSKTSLNIEQVKNNFQQYRIKSKDLELYLDAEI